VKTLARCPACHSERLHTYRASRATGRAIARCRDCDLHAWANYTPPPLAITTRDGVSGDDYDGYVSIKREQAAPEAWRAGLRRILAELGGPQTASLYDIGAGDGAFLRMAQDEFGFKVAGNEVFEGAADLARARHEIDLELGDLANLGHYEDFDAATLWCVLAHTYDGDALLEAVRVLLRPGGILFMQTPRWTTLDGAALTALRATGGRVSRLVDRRVASHHWVLHSRRSITRQLERLGYEVLSAEPRARYSLSSPAYLASLGIPERAVPVLGRAMDSAISHGASFRIVLDVCARKPAR
jgi:SAM-dependent methyltransferase